MAYAPIIYVLAFAAVVILAQTVAGLMFSAKDRTIRINRRLTMLDSGMEQDEVYSALMRRSAPLKVGGVRLANLHGRVEAYCRQAGVQATPARLLGIIVGVAFGFWLFGLTLISRAGHGLILNGLMSLGGSCVLSLLGVWFWIRGKRNKRLRQIEEQLPIALDIINRAIRAGHPVVAAVQMSAQEMGDPLGTEFGLIVDETIYGSEFKEALASFARRTGSRDAHFFSVAVGIQSETGGNLAEILEGLSKVIRGRVTLGKRVKALASEGRASAYLLSALPVAIIAFQFVVHPTTYTDKFSDPIFWPVVSIVMIVYFLGWAMIQRIINFKY